MTVLNFVQTPFAYCEEITTNAAVFETAPKWLTESKVETTVANIQRYMEWDIRKVKVKWFSDPIAFQKAHGYDSSVLAVSFKPENTIFLGPKVDASNFSGIFGHELVHIILFQKYKKAIPDWLEEGLANYVSKRNQVDYTWLNSQPNQDYSTLIHPFQKSSSNTAATATDVRYHYQASTALIEMIASKCNLADLLQLSVGEKLENYLHTFCGVKDIKNEFSNWIKKKSAVRHQ